ncbi:MAG: hypothetical protein JRI73_11040, partial [Deltaproteobacteria bacterium]|nr:hypothetical protein [Deltaproteobacteria bacterium]
RVATITAPTLDWNGSATISFTATDAGLLFDSDPATFTVTPVNDVPVVSDIPDQSIAEGASFATISLDDFVTDIDDPDAQIVWSYSSSSNLTISIVSQVATITANDADWNGSELITFTATDTAGLFASDGATFTVNPVNDAPVVAGVPDQTIVEGNSFTAINLDDYVTDIDNVASEMTWSYSGNVELSVSIVNRVAIVGLPDADWNGAETITFTAADPGSLNGSDAAVFTVTGVNDAPVVSDIPDQTVVEGSSFATIILDNYVSDIDNLDSDLRIQPRLWSLRPMTLQQCRIFLISPWPKDQASRQSISMTMLSMQIILTAKSVGHIQVTLICRSALSVGWLLSLPLTPTGTVRR